MFLQLLFLVSLVSSKFVKEEGIVVLNDVNFRYMKPNLYLDDYERSVVIEALVRPEDLTDIDPSSEYYAWVKDYTLALAKETIGRVRSKFQVDGSPYQLDGESILSEAQSMKTELENKLTGTIFVI